ncbi:MAG: VWA domain-containing protein [Chloracidobacterium sp.]|nr:VWA domain-containing protein [Chloracidobacterium sp.]
MIRCLTIATVCLLTLAISGMGQSRRNNRGDSIEGTVLPVIAERSGKNEGPIKIEDLFLYENGVEQRIRNFVPDPSPSRILVLVDNSQTLPVSTDTLKKAVMEFAYEIFEGDQLFVVAYDEKAEIIQEWTDDAKKMEASLETFRKRGNPNLFDALEISMKEILLPLMPGTRKTAVVLVGDGLDRGSKATFDKILAEYQNENVAVYSLQIADRTGGAYRRDQPKAAAIMTRLADETGGKVFPFEEAQAAAKAICDELRRNRYLLSYLPTNATSFDSRRLLLTASEGINIRMKTAQPPNVK